MGSGWAIVVASGPSLTRADCVALRGAGYTLAINCAVFFVPWADELFAGDGGWWRYYGSMVNWYKGGRVSKTFTHPTVRKWYGKGWPRTGGNSGHMGIQYLVDNGYKKIAIIGFDQQVKNDNNKHKKVHYHRDHPKVTREGARTNLGNGTGVKAWPRLMTATSVDLVNRGVKVINLSRETALKCFERMTVEQFLVISKGDL